MSEARTLLWDFFGPNAQRTAEHFKQHLEQFLQKHELSGCETGTRSEQPGHFAAFCRAPEAAQETLLRSLRPQRAL